MNTLASKPAVSFLALCLSWPIAAADLSSAAPQALSTVAVVAANGLEGLDVGPDGTIYLTNATSHALQKVTPGGEIADIASLAVVPQVVLRTADGFVITAQVKEPDFAALMKPGAPMQPLGAAVMGALEGRALDLDSAGRVRSSISAPAGSFLNGMDRFGSDYLIADSTAGTIWQWRVKQRRLDPWLKDAALAPTEGRFPGANGLKVVGRSVYVANTTGGVIYRIAVGARGQPEGPLQVVAKIPSPDDFAVAADGTLYVPSSGRVFKVLPDGATSVLAEGCAGCDAALLADRGRVLYLITHGFGPNAGAGHVYRLALSAKP